MTYDGLDLFDIILERLEGTVGHVVISLREEKDFADILKFESEDELKEHFDIKFNSMYRSYMLVPKLDEDGLLTVDDMSVEVNEYELYYVIDGELQK